MNKTSRIVTLCISDEPLKITNENDAIFEVRTIGLYTTEKEIKQLLEACIKEICEQMLLQLNKAAKYSV